MSTQKILAAIIFIVVITQDAYESPGMHTQADDGFH